MDDSLIRFFAPHTQEEESLLRGEPLAQGRYTDRSAFIVEGERFVPSRQMISLRPHTRFADFPMHWHDYVEMMYMLQGETLHGMPDGSTVRLQAGELLLINRHSAHSIARCGENDIAVNFLIQQEFLDFVPDMIGTHNVLGRFLLDALRNYEQDMAYLHFRVAEISEIQWLLQSIVHSLIAPKAAGLQIRRTEMGLLFLHLLSRPECMRMPAATHQENLVVIELLQEIRQNYADFVLRDFARRKHVSSAYLCKVLKEATGKNCTALLQERRIEKAKRMLRETNLSVMEICAAVGYSNSSYFYRIFESATGMSPSAWRVNSGCDERR